MFAACQAKVVQNTSWRDKIVGGNPFKKHQQLLWFSRRV